MIDDLISRQAAIDELIERIRANGYTNAALVSELKRSIGYLMLLPSAEPKRKHGYWNGKPICGYATVRCSVCGEAFLENNGRWKYCPNCGADMREENDNGRFD